MRRPDPLTDPSAPSARRLVSLSGRRARLRHGLARIEGPQACLEAVRWRADDLRDVYVTRDVRERETELMAALCDARTHIHEMSNQVASAVAPAGQGIVATLRLDAVTTDLDRLLAFSAPFLVVLAGVQDPGNVGTIVRIADACGADGVVSCAGGADLASPKVIRSSAGSCFHLPLVDGPDFSEAVASLAAAGIATYGADPHAGLTLPQVLGQLPSALAWVVGNEARGFSDSERESLDETIAIPMWGHAESLNVATAAAICLYETAQVRAQ
ncbi:MAG: RNA methyltransferase [Actinomycetaceae bacterium]|nr:RNA methyltransferase [Actinomycetaceae bacterium]